MVAIDFAWEKPPGSCEGGTLPVIMSITGPRETHDYRVRNL